MADTCSFKHRNIDQLFGVSPVPIADLPKVCTCGEELTYAHTVAFVTRVNGPSYDRSAEGKDIAAEEDFAVVWEQIK